MMISKANRAAGTQSWFGSFIQSLDLCLSSQGSYVDSEGQRKSLILGYPCRTDFYPGNAGFETAYQVARRSATQHSHITFLDIEVPAQENVHPWLWVHELGHIFLYFGQGKLDVDIPFGVSMDLDVYSRRMSQENLARLGRTTNYEPGPAWLESASRECVDMLATLVMYLGLRSAGYSEESTTWLTGLPSTVALTQIEELESDATTKAYLDSARVEIVPLVRALALQTVASARAPEHYRYSLALDLDGVLITKNSEKPDSGSIDAVDPACWLPLFECLMPDVYPDPDSEYKPDIGVDQIFLSSSRRKLYDSPRDFYDLWALPQLVDPLISPCSVEQRIAWSRVFSDFEWQHKTHYNQPAMQLLVDRLRDTTWELPLKREAEQVTGKSFESASHALSVLKGEYTQSGYKPHDRLSEIILTLLLHHEVRKAKSSLDFTQWLSPEFMPWHIVVVLDDSSDAHRPLSPYEAELLTAARTTLIHVQTSWENGLLDLDEGNSTLERCLRRIYCESNPPLQQYV